MCGHGFLGYNSICSDGFVQLSTVQSTDHWYYNRPIWQIVGHPVCNTTIISAYYRISSKHSHEEYLAWMKNFLSLKDCMVLFCSPETCNTMQSLRPSSYPALIFPRPMESFLMSRLLSDVEWAQQEHMDKEKVFLNMFFRFISYFLPQHLQQDTRPGHNRLLYKVWNEKTNMMKIVADINPFSSSYFVWLDIGAVRHSRFNHQLMVQRWPAEPGILLLSIAQFTQAELELGIQGDFSGVDRLGDTTIGSGLESLAA